MRRVGGWFALYGANATGAFGSLLVIRFATSWAGFDAYAQIALYFLSFAVLQAFEPAVIRKALDIFGDKREGQHLNGIIAAWTLSSLSVGALLSIALATIVFSSTMSEGLALTLLMTGVVDYVLGRPILHKAVTYSATGDQARLAIVSLVQNLSRYGALILIVWVGEGHPTYIWLLPLRRALDLVALHLLDRSVSREGARTGSPSADFALLGEALLSYGSTIAWLMLATEGVGVLVYLNFGEADFGRYRALFDLASKLWFITSVFPLLLYPKLRRVGLGKPALRLLRIALPLSLISYAVVALLGWLLAPSLFQLLFPRLAGLEWMFFLVLIGVALTGHARFSLECLQAFGVPRTAAIAAALFAVMMLGLFQFIAQHSSVTTAVAGAWISSAALLAVGADERVMAVAGASTQGRLLVPLQMAVLLIVGTAVVSNILRVG